ncbi:MAG TPA: hypothetical protein VKR54_01410 [Candidatus Babeliales bacterium]|jgi:hypothetical protein|nr:hypothetical protein [Candidatus Babeliales bacterium]
MLKKLYLASAMSLVSLSALGASITDFSTTTLTAQLNHINAQINAAKRAWNEARVRIKQAEKASSSLSATVKQTFEKIISSNEFIERMNTKVDQQFESIVNNNMSFRDVKTENSLSDFSSQSMETFGTILYAAMANKAYYLLLGRKLAQKSKELAATIRGLQQGIANRQNAFPIVSL